MRSKFSLLGFANTHAAESCEKSGIEDRTESTEDGKNNENNNRYACTENNIKNHFN